MRNLIISAIKSLLMIAFCVSFGIAVVMLGAWLQTINN